MKSPIFIFSLPRSGSTLLQRILGSHNKISTTAEPWILLPFVYTLKQNVIFTEYDHRTCYKAFSDFIAQLPNNKDDYWRCLAGFAQSLYEKNMRPDTLYFLDKTPRYYLIIPEIVRMFPQAKFIFLFRNPLQVLASVITTWSKGRFYFQNNHIDLYRGPKLLADGFEKFIEKSFKVNYDELVSEPQSIVKNICEYLEIDFNNTLIDNISKFKLNARLGDVTGERVFKAIDSSPKNKWKDILNTKYRKKFVKKYLNELGHNNLKTFGYDLDELISQIDNLPSAKGGFIVDRIYKLTGDLLRLTDAQMFKRKFLHRINSGDSFFPLR